jgi:hypothetical protein
MRHLDLEPRMLQRPLGDRDLLADHRGYGDLVRRREQEDRSRRSGRDQEREQAEPQPQVPAPRRGLLLI